MATPLANDPASLKKKRICKKLKIEIFIFEIPKINTNPPIAPINPPKSNALSSNVKTALKIIRYSFKKTKNFKNVRFVHPYKTMATASFKTLSPKTFE